MSYVCERQCEPFVVEHSLLSHLLSLLNALGLDESFLDLVPDIPAIDPEKMWKNKR